MQFGFQNFIWTQTAHPFNAYKEKPYECNYKDCDKFFFKAEC
jgi:hypothetical protein